MKYSLTQHMFEKGNEIILPGQHISLLAVRWTVPVEQLEIIVQCTPDLHLSLVHTAGVQKVDHCGQTAQGHPEQLRVPGILCG